MSIKGKNSYLIPHTTWCNSEQYRSKGIEVVM